MILHNLQQVRNVAHTDILVKDRRIAGMGNIAAGEAHQPSIFFENAIVFPGLINSHDHLDFNLFPKLGNSKYNNYVEWGNDIHENNKDTIDAVLKIPRELRIEWGLYKNLLAGVTTVVNHGPGIAETDLITISQNCKALHSVQHEKNFFLKLIKPAFSGKALAIHIGEGTDNESQKEIDKLISWNLWMKEIIAIHGISMSARQAQNFRALIWCPDSNYFLMGRTAAIQHLKDFTTVLLGTDSTVSSAWNIWEHLRLARSENCVSDEELFLMVSESASQVWGLESTGSLEPGFDADIVVARPEAGATGYDAYYAVNPEDILMVLHKGDIRLFDASLFDQLAGYIDLRSFTSVSIEGSSKYVSGDLVGLMSKIKNYYPGVSFPCKAN